MVTTAAGVCGLFERSGVRSRRDFLATGSRALLAGALPALGKALPAMGQAAENRSGTERIPLDRDWFFRTDQAAAGERGRWYQPDLAITAWTSVRVPHTWQVMPGLEEYRGIAWYRCSFDGRREWKGKIVRIEFEAVFHSATVWANGKAVGEHLRKGYTTFSLDITPVVRLRGPNVVAVRVDNAFDDAMLPRGRSSDWAHDGGIYRPVWLVVTPPISIERVAVEAMPDFAANTAAIEVTATVRNATGRAARITVDYRVEDASHNVVVDRQSRPLVTIQPGELRSVPLPTSELRDPKLWHFDSPKLYQLLATLSAPEQGTHRLTATFGIRRIEISNGGFYLNGERVRLMGVERMAGSNPEFGMAESGRWITHDHDDLKELNCIFTRAHWPQDHRVLDYCDRHGILFQSEVPVWGPNTFKGMGREPLPALLDNGLEQLTEMIERDRNHPCIF